MDRLWLRPRVQSGAVLVLTFGGASLCLVPVPVSSPSEERGCSGEGSTVP